MEVDEKKLKKQTNILLLFNLMILIEPSILPIPFRSKKHVFNSTPFHQAFCLLQNPQNPNLENVKLRSALKCYLHFYCPLFALCKSIRIVTLLEVCKGRKKTKAQVGLELRSSPSRCLLRVLVTFSFWANILLCN